MSVYFLVLSHLSVALAGAAAGFWGARLTLALDRVHHAVVPQEAPVPEQEAKTWPHVERRRASRRQKFETALIFVAVLGSLVASIMAGVTQRQDARQDECLNDYANRLADALEPRQRAAEQLQVRDDVVNAAIVDVLTPGNNDADINHLRLAAAAKEHALDELARQRRANPYPEAPRAICADD